MKRNKWNQSNIADVLSDQVKGELMFKSGVWWDRDLDGKWCEISEAKAEAVIDDLVKCHVIGYSSKFLSGVIRLLKIRLL